MMELFDLTFAQKKFYFTDAFYGNSSINNINIIIDIKKSIDYDAINAILNNMVNHFDSLRLHIIDEEGTPKQYIRDHEYINYDLAEAEDEDELNRKNEELVNISVFGLDKDLYRFTVFYVKSVQRYVVLFTLNHIITDAYSMQIIADYFYKSLTDQDPDSEEVVSFREVVEDEEKYRGSKRFIDDKEFWDEKIRSFEGVSMFDNRPDDDSCSQIWAERIDSDMLKRINSFCEEIEISISLFFSVVSSIYKSYVTNNDSVAIMTLLHNRRKKSFRAIPGGFACVQPMILSLSGDQDIRSFFITAKREDYNIMKHGRYDTEVTSDENLKHMLEFMSSYQPLNLPDEWYSTMYVDQVYSSAHTDSLCIHITNYNKSIGDDLELRYEYCTSFISLDEVKLMHERIMNIIAHVLDRPDDKLKDLNIYSKNELDTITAFSAGDVKEYQCSRTIAALFEEQAEKTPDNTAVVFKDDSITYRELNTRANILAHKLRALGVRPNDFVAVIAERSIEMICGIYGIIKAGGAYVPIDPTYPDDRIAFMLEDSKPKAVLKYTTEIITIDSEIPVIDLSDREVWEGASENPELVNKPEDLIYCIYTSGTTGRPKGVPNINKGLINRIFWMNTLYPLGENDTILQKTTFTFDVSVWEIVWWSLVGARVAMLVPGGEKEPDTICNAIEKYSVTTMHFVPSMLSIFEDYVQSTGSAGRKLKSLRNVFASGEALKKVHVEQFYGIAEKNGLGMKLANFYGPTEASIDVTYYDCIIEDRDIVPIGRPIYNTQIYITNKGKLCGIGVSGELCIAGDGLAVGYLNRPELTGEKFIANPFGEGKMYRTGDLARWMPDGNIEYLGRIDDQVKIRGQRIELGEIESRIREVEGIKDCAVIAKADNSGDKAIYAYYTSDTEKSISEIKERLSAGLPEYMVPAYMMQIDAIPVTRNGKLDRRALPEITARAVNEYAAPRNAVEKMLCEAFSEILGIERVGINDSFFELGGHSLRATRLVNTIEAETGKRIAVKDILTHPTPAQLAEVVESSVQEYTPIPKAEDKEYYPMSSAQKRTYLIQQMDPDSLSYHMPGVLKLTGEVRPNDLKKALQTIVDRHEILRTQFISVNGEFLQHILEKAEAEFECDTDISSKTDQELLMEYVRTFDLSAPPLLRMKVTRREGYNLLLFDMHHIISDGMSVNVLITEFMTVYNGGTPEPLTHQFRDYSEWMRTRDLSGQADYWKSQFDGEIPVLDMPTDYPRPAEQNYEGASVEAELSSETFDAINALSESSGATAYMIFLAAFMVTLSKYSRQEDIVIGSPISGRTHRDTENMLGMFVNTLAMRGRPEKNKTFSEFLSEVSETCLKAYENQEYPFEELVDAVNVRRDMSRNPIFDVMLTLQNNEEVKLDLGDTGIEFEEIEITISKFDLSVDIAAENGTYKVRLEYCTALFSGDTAEHILENYLAVLRNAALSPEKKLSSIEMITDSDKAMVVDSFNAAEAEYQDHNTVAELFEAQVMRTPDSIAVVYEGSSLTYRELNERANAIACRLREIGVKPDDFVAVMAEKSLELICGIYGIIKSGGAYVPVDPAYPEDRIAFILGDCKPKAVLKYTTESISIENEIPVIDLADSKVWEGARENPEHISKPEDLAYCIYTSGTTGMPKGVLIENRNLCSYVSQFCDYYGINSDSVIIQQAYVGFDTSIEELYPVLLRGGRMVIVPQDVLLDSRKLNGLINEHRVNIISCSPLLINELTELDKSSLKTLISGGDVLKPEYIMEALKCGISVYNTYGPTEATVCASYYKAGSDTGSNIPIGKPIANARIYIMQEDCLCGVGVPGELCIAGNGVARGYLNRPELTAEKFVKDPFGEGRMYRSGDLARWLPDGNIEYLGRIDEQVKIRGFRIELGEIECRISEIEGIKDCAAIARADGSGDMAVYAYFTSDEEKSLSEIRDRLSASLPEYMVPAYMMQIESIPVTKNGKLDKRALPDISAKTTREYIAPRTETEEKICRIISEILSVERVGVNDSFFELGGHSLRATRLVNCIEAETGVRIALKDVFSHPTAAQLAEIADSSDQVYVPIPKAEEKEYYPMSSAQKRTYLIQQMDTSSTAYNMPGGLKLRGEVRADDLKKALQTIIDRHEILRTQFLMVGGELVQKILDYAEADFEYISEVSEKTDQELVDEYIRPFDLSAPPLLRMKLVNKQSYHLLVFDMHHIISDGMSVNIIINEFMTLYGGGKLEPLTHQFRDYSEWMRTRDLSGQAEYWKSQFDDEIPVLDMPTDYPRTQEQSHAGAAEEAELSRETCDAIDALAERSGATAYMVYLAALMVTLSKYSRQEDIVVGSPISGRTHRDTENMLGMFVNTLAMRGKPEKDKTFSTFLSEIKETCLKAYENQEYPFEELVDEVDVKRDMSRNPLFDVLLVLQNNENTELSLDGSDAEEASAEGKVSKLDLTFTVAERDGKKGIMLVYCTALFSKETAQLLIRHYTEVLRTVTADENCKLSDIEMTTAEERKQILADFNATETAYPENRTAAELFEEQADRTPDNIAVVYEDKSLTYRELNERANVIAHKLRALGLKPDDFAAIIADRSIEMICGIYGIIKAGGAYVPVDPSYPEDRIAFMLDDCQPKAVLKYTTESISVDNGIPVIDLADSEVWEGTRENPEHVNRPEDLAYCIYTSGTTGKPKGVVLENRSLLNHISVLREKFYQNKTSRVTPLFTSFAFDFTVPAVFGTLLCGDTLAVMKDAHELAEYSRNNKLAVLKITPSYFNGIYDEFDDHKGNVEVVVFGGETLTEHTTDHVRAVFGNDTEIYNEYGPTEATVFTSAARIREGDIITIGKPVNNSRIYITENNKLCGIGVPGELCIAGEGVARGYINRPELTAEKFVKDPFGEGRMYRSGDLARWLPDGNIEYIGRIDEQVKIRGFRIELGEIENRIREIEGIKDSAVIARTDSTGDKAIYAYYTGDSEVSVSDVRDRLSASLPEYMVPAYMMQIESIPVTKNGKLDKRALPEIEAKAAREYVAPRNETEAGICAVFSEILGVERVGVKDSFFELGGHSLRATRLVNRIEAETGTRIALKEVFNHPTPEQLAVLAEADNAEYVPIPKAEEKEYYPMSSSQKRTYLFQQLDPDALAYNMPSCMKITGNVRPDDLRAALQAMIDRHEILRTQFLVVDGEPVQKILDHIDADFVYITSSESDEKLMENFVKPFDICSGHTVRAQLTDKGEYSLLMFDMHHIVGDGMSDTILVSEVMSIYNGEQLPPLTHQFKDYSEWMRTRDLSGQAEYWKSQFDDEIPVLDMPTDFPRPQDQSYDGAIISTVLDKELYDAVNVLSERSGATDYMVFLAVLMITLSKYSRQEDIVIGSPISGRTHRDTERMLGMFINTLAMRGNPEKSKTFSAFLSEIKEICFKAYENQEYPFEELVEAVNVRRDMSRNPIFDVLLTMQNNERVQLRLGETEVENMEFADNTAKFDISVDIKLENGTYKLELEYCTALFTRNTAEHFLDNLLIVLKNVVSAPEQKIECISMISDADRKLITGEFNSAEAEYPRNETAAGLFEEQVRRNPDNTAVVFEEQKLTYAELNARANVIANKLTETGAKPDDLIVVIADRSIEMIVCILGIIKAGAAYLPIDPAYPGERITFMLEDSNAKAVLKYTDEEVMIPENRKVIDIKNVDWNEGCTDDPERVITPDNLVYCIYTSGTTGTPKGVVLENTGLIGLVRSYEEVFGITADDRMLQFASFCFDQSVGDIFGALLNGASLYVVSSDMRYNMSDLEAYMNKAGITVASLTPKVIRELDICGMPELRLLDSGGEAAEPDVLRAVAASGKKVINSYGPTEATVNTTYSEIKADTERVTIGRPACHTQVYIMQGDLLCGIGVPGELCIAGDGVARGYLNRPELTAEKFVRSPFSEGRMYRTGDLARWLSDGNIEYLGRIDEQVKIRGFRIELGEIESRIREIEGIKDCAVIAREDGTGDKAILAYYTSDSEVSVSEIRDRLSASLPEYMVPSYMMQIEAIPVTRNGKLDRRALPEIKAKTINEYVAPRNETEEKICRIFSEILGAEKVGIRDSFFELGGHSLRATRLVNSIEAETGVRIALKEVFSHPTPEQLAEAVNGAAKEYMPIPKAEEKEYYPMSSAQKRTYLIQQMDPDSVAYNMPGALKLTGDVRPDDLRRALQAMTDRHEILRTQFLMIDGEPVQKIQDHIDADFEYTSSSKPDAELIDEFCKPFDLSSGRPVRAKLVDKGDHHLMMLDMHHIVGDGMSDNIFISEFMALYNGEKLEPLTHQFRDYSEWMRTRDLSGQAEYWKSQFDDDIPVLDMPTDFPRPQEQSYAGASVSALLDADTYQAAAKLSEKSGATAYMIFLAAFMTTLSKYSRQEDIVVGSPISGRTHKDTENMLGMFVNTLAMRGKPEKDKTFNAFLSEVKETCLKAYENQEYPFEELVDAVNVRRDMSRNPLFDVMLTMQNNETVKTDPETAENVAEDNDSTTSKFDLSVSIVEENGTYRVYLDYCTALFTNETAERILENFMIVLKNAVDAPEQKLGSIDMISDADKALISGEFNASETEYPGNKTAADLFEEQAERTPDSVAAVYEDSSLTYRELNSRANFIAYKLLELGLKADDLAAVIADRSVEMIESIFGIIKAGGAYVPIDPTYPEDRITFMLEDSNAKAVVMYTDEDVVVPEGMTVIDLRNIDMSCECNENPVRDTAPENLVYCIYTSGTTGNPKGVLIRNSSLVNLSTGFMPLYLDESVQNVGLVASYAFDASVKMIFGALLSGKTLFVVSNERKYDIAGLLHYYDDNSVDATDFTPSHLKMAVASGVSKKYDLKYIYSGGENLDTKTAAELLEKKICAGIINVYGPTECTVDSTYLAVTDTGERVTIGKPVPNAKIYIMQGDSLCGIGVPGELCIAGEGVARGYLNRPELTAEKFVKAPFGDGRMYRSGDLARWLPDGSIEYLGRIDEQVKIRGFRIELGEIESRMREIENVKECAVIAKPDSSGDMAVYAYFTSDREMSVSEIRNILRSGMPEYMVPSYMMQTDSIPVTKNGKLDKRALPDIVNRAAGEYIAPSTETEKQIAEICSRELNIDKISIRENFFEIGANSLKLMSIAMKIDAVYPSLVKIVDFFADPTIESIAALIDKRMSGEHNVQIVPVVCSDELFDVSDNSGSSRAEEILTPEMSEALLDLAEGSADELAHIAVSAFVFVISQLFGTNDVSVQYIDDTMSDDVIQLNIDLSAAESFSDIIDLVNKALTVSDNVYSLNDYARYIPKNRNESVPLFVNGNADYEYLEKYDLVFGCEYNDTVRLTGRANSSRINESYAGFIVGQIGQVFGSLI